MKKQVFVSVAMGVMTAWTTPIVLAQSASVDTEHLNRQEHQLTDKDWHSSKEVAEVKNIRASKLIGINVTSKEGENLGQVQDLVVDPETGKIRFALVGQGFMAGLGQKLIPVPWKAVNVHSEREFALNVDKSKMLSAPAWSQSEQEQPEYVIRVYRFYELEPTDQVGGPGSSDQQSGQGHGESSEHNGDDGGGQK